MALKMCDIKDRGQETGNLRYVDLTEKSQVHCRMKLLPAVIDNARSNDKRIKDLNPRAKVFAVLQLNQMTLPRTLKSCSPISARHILLGMD